MRRRYPRPAHIGDSVAACISLQVERQENVAVAIVVNRSVKSG